MSTCSGRSSACAAAGRARSPARGCDAAVGSGHVAGLLVLDALVQQHRRVAAVVEDHVRPVVDGAVDGDPATSSSARCTTSTPRASRPSRRTPGHPAGSRRCRSVPPPPRQQRDPASRRCCSSPNALRRRAHSASRSAPRSGWSCGANRRSVRRPAAWSRRTPCAGPSDRASRARRGSSPCARTAPARGRRRGSRVARRGWMCSRSWCRQCRSWRGPSRVGGTVCCGVRERANRAGAFRHRSNQPGDSVHTLYRSSSGSSGTCAGPPRDPATSPRRPRDVPDTGIPDMCETPIPISADAAHTSAAGRAVGQSGSRAAGGSGVRAVSRGVGRSGDRAAGQPGGRGFEQ